MIRDRFRRVMRLATTVAAAAAVVGMMAVSATATTTIKQTLVGTVHAPSASGQAKLHLKTGSSGKFSIKVRRLPARKSFDVVVNKIKVGTLTTSAGGSGLARFSTSPKGRNAMLGFDPQGGQVEVRDENGDDVLDGDMPDESPDSAMGCCLGSGHDSAEVECEDLTAAECTAKGGSATTVTSCLPDPCGGTPPPVSIVCCLADSAAGAMVDDDPEVECEDLSEADCAAAGGTVVQASSCDGNPCQPVPPPNVVVCCVPDGNESECEILTPEHCSGHGGTVNAAASCSGDPCGSGDSGGDGSGSDGGDPTEH